MQRVVTRKAINAFRRMGFVKKSQKGSHLKLERRTSFGSKVTCVIPMHEEIRPKTFRRILQQAGISESEFFYYYK